MKIKNLTSALPEKGSFAWIMMMMGLASIVLILLPFAFWYAVWHGPSIGPGEVEKALAEPVEPSAAGSMVLRIAEKISRQDRSMQRWYPRLIELSRHAAPHLRRTAAWAMGKDPKSDAFHARLREMVNDQDRHVRRAAAVSLSAFEDPAARKELVAAIRPHVVLSTLAGSVNLRILPKDTASPETAVARVGDSFVEAGIFGTVKRLLVKEGDPVSAGQPLVEITPAPEEARDMLRALARVGVQEDLAAIRECLGDSTEAMVRDEGQNAIRAIERRGNSTAGVRIQ